MATRWSISGNSYSKRSNTWSLTSAETASSSTTMAPHCAKSTFHSRPSPTNTSSFASRSKNYTITLTKYSQNHTKCLQINHWKSTNPTLTSNLVTNTSRSLCPQLYPLMSWLLTSRIKMSRIKLYCNLQSCMNQETVSLRNSSLRVIRGLPR